MSIRRANVHVRINYRASSQRIMPGVFWKYVLYTSFSLMEPESWGVARPVRKVFIMKLT